MKEARQLTDEADGMVTSELLDALVGYRLRRAMTRVSADFRATMNDLSLRPVLFAMLAVIRENPGINQTMLGRTLGIQVANLVPLLGELASRSLIERRPVPADKRVLALHLSALGSQLFAEAAERVAAHEQRILSDLDPGEQQRLLELLDRVGKD